LFDKEKQKRNIAALDTELLTTLSSITDVTDEQVSNFGRLTTTTEKLSKLTEMIREGTAIRTQEEKDILELYKAQLEQIKKQVGGDGNSPSIIDVQKSITPLTLIACGIENCGYMEENQTLPTSALCNMKAAKYFGRLVRSLDLSKTVNVADYLKIAGELDTKKKKGEACDKDLTVLISEINGLIKPSAAGGYRRRKQKVTRRGHRCRRSTRRHYGKRR
jgi:hypothetical protein